MILSEVLKPTAKRPNRYDPAEVLKAVAAAKESPEFHQLLKHADYVGTKTTEGNGTLVFKRPDDIVKYSIYQDGMIRGEKQRFGVPSGAPYRLLTPRPRGGSPRPSPDLPKDLTERYKHQLKRLHDWMAKQQKSDYVNKAVKDERRWRSQELGDLR